MATWGSGQIGWVPKDYEAETLGPGLCLGLVEGKIGLFPWWDGDRWDIGKPGGEFF